MNRRETLKFKIITLFVCTDWLFLDYFVIPLLKSKGLEEPAVAVKIMLHVIGILYGLYLCSVAIKGIKNNLEKER